MLRGCAGLRGVGRFDHLVVGFLKRKHAKPRKKVGLKRETVNGWKKQSKDDVCARVARAKRAKYASEVAFERVARHGALCFTSSIAVDCSLRQRALSLEKMASLARTSCGPGCRILDLHRK